MRSKHESRADNRKRLSSKTFTVSDHRSHNEVGTIRFNIRSYDIEMSSIWVLRYHPTTKQVWSKTKESFNEQISVRFEEFLGQLSCPKKSFARTTCEHRCMVKFWNLNQKCYKFYYGLQVQLLPSSIQSPPNCHSIMILESIEATRTLARSITFSFSLASRR